MEDYFLGLAILMVLACLGVYIVKRFGQSMIIAYLLVGILIGPNLVLNFGSGLTYSGIIRDESVIWFLLEMGLIFVFFFAGLEFSIRGLKETKKGATIFAIAHVSMNILLGFGLATALGWPLFDSIFLAGVISISSVAVGVKSLTDLHKLNGNEVKYFLGINIVEDFILILMIALATMAAVYGSFNVWGVFRTSIGLVVLYSFFLVLGFVVIPILMPKIHDWIEKNDGDEILILFTLAAIFFSVAFASLLEIPAPFGAFFMGMAMAGTSFSERVTKRMTGIKIGFTALFFMSFGMLISFNPDVIATVALMLLVAVPLLLMNEVLVLGAIGYMMGLTAKASMTIGACMAGRGEDTLLFASVGSSIRNKATNQLVLAKSTQIISFSGIFCFILAVIVPVMMRKIDSFANFITRILPKQVKFGGTVVQRTLIKPVLGPDGDYVAGNERVLLLLFVMFGAGLVATMLAPIPLVYLLGFNSSVIALLWIWVESDKFLGPLITEERYEQLHVRHLDMERIRAYIHLMVIMPLTMMFMTVAVWSGIALLGLPFWWLAIVAMFVCLGFMLQATWEIYGSTMGSWDVKSGPKLKPKVRPDEGVAAANVDKTSAVPLYIYRGQGSKGKPKPDAAAGTSEKARTAKFKSVPLENLMKADDDDAKAMAEEKQAGRMTVASSSTKKDVQAKAASMGAGLKGMLHIGKKATDVAKDDDVPEEVLQMDEPPRPVPFRPPPGGVPRPPARAARRMQPRPALSSVRTPARAVPLSRGDYRMTVRPPLTFMPEGNRYRNGGGRPGQRRPPAHGGPRRASMRRDIASGRPMMNRPQYRRTR